MTIPIKHRQIEAFRAVMILGSVSAAADSMFISQPAVSRLLADLEKSVGFCLFERLGRGIIPSADGRLLFETVERVYLGLETIQDAAKLIREGDIGAVRVGALPVYAEGVMAESVGRFLSDSPGIHIELESSDKKEILAGLKSKRFDLAISTLPIVEKGIKETKLGSREALCILPVKHPLAKRSKVPLEALMNYSFVSLSKDNPFRQTIEQMIESVGGSINEVAATRTQRAAGLMVAKGAGISIVDPDVCRYFSPELITTRALEPAISWEFGLLSLSETIPTVATTKFADFCRLTIS